MTAGESSAAWGAEIPEVPLDGLYEIDRIVEYFRNRFDDEVIDESVVGVSGEHHGMMLLGAPAYHGDKDTILTQKGTAEKETLFRRNLALEFTKDDDAKEVAMSLVSLDGSGLDVEGLSTDELRNASAFTIVVGEHSAYGVAWDAEWNPTYDDLMHVIGFMITGARQKRHQMAVEQEARKSGQAKEPDWSEIYRDNHIKPTEEEEENEIQDLLNEQARGLVRKRVDRVLNDPEYRERVGAPYVSGRGAIFSGIRVPVDAEDPTIVLAQTSGVDVEMTRDAYLSMHEFGGNRIITLRSIDGLPFRFVTEDGGTPEDGGEISVVAGEDDMELDIESVTGRPREFEPHPNLTALVGRTLARVIHVKDQRTQERDWPV